MPPREVLPEFLLACAFVWGTPLLLASGLRSFWIHRHNLLPRIVSLLVYAGWSIVWVTFWIKDTERTRESFPYEVAFKAGIWMSPIAGGLLVVSLALLDLRKQGGQRVRGFPLD